MVRYNNVRLSLLQVAQQAIDSDVHVVGVSSLAAGHRTLVRTTTDRSSKLVIFSPFWMCMYYIQHCCICRPAKLTVSGDAGIKPRTVATLALAVRQLSDALTTRPDLTHIWDLFFSNLDVTFFVYFLAFNPSFKKNVGTILYCFLARLF